MGSNISKAVTIKQNVQLLEYLQENKTDKAKELVEMLLDGEVIYYVRGIPGTEEDRKAVSTALSKKPETIAANTRELPSIRKLIEAVAKVFTETEKNK